MPYLDFSADNIQKTAPSFERLSLKHGETARISLLNFKPVARWVHTLEKPVLDEDGNLVMETRTRQNGSSFERVKTAFVSKVTCMGDERVLNEQGIDPDNCPICRAFQEYPDRFDAPKRRFAMNVFQYDTQKDGSLKGVYHGFIKVWAFPDSRFSKLVDIKNDLDGGDLGAFDLRLGPCENETFQKFDIVPSTKKAEWAASEATRARTKEIVTAAAYSDEVLYSACAKDANPQFVSMDMLSISREWERAGRGPVAAQAPDALPPTTAELSNFLDSVEPPPSTHLLPAVSSTEETPVIPPTSSESSFEPVVEQLTIDDAIAEEEAQAPPEATTVNFDDILREVGITP